VLPNALEKKEAPEALGLRLAFAQELIASLSIQRHA